MILGLSLTYHSVVNAWIIVSDWINVMEFETVSSVWNTNLFIVFELVINLGTVNAYQWSKDRLFEVRDIDHMFDKLPNLKPLKVGFRWI